MELYLLKSAAVLAIFFAFYKLFLENTSIHTFKRFYLLGILFASFLIPLITFYSYVAVAPITTIYSQATLPIIQPEIDKTINYWPFILWTIYGLGVLFFSVKFFKNLFGLIQKIRSNPKFKNGSFTNVLLTETVIPHTFFNYIFLNKQQFENGEIPQQVMLHEQTHAREKHSLDVIFVELLQLVFWFNPLLYFIKRSIKLNHEFLADVAVLNSGAETSEYQKILLAFSSPDSYRDAFMTALAHSLNYSSIKKRFTVMKTHTSKRGIWLRSLLILPLLSVLIYGFSSKEIIQKNAENTELAKEKATKAEIAEYNKLAKKYNAIAIEKRIIPLKDLKVLETIYRKMDDEQKSNSQPFPECIPPLAPNVSKTNKGETPLPTPPAPSLHKNNGNALNISRSKETGFHFNTQKSTLSTIYYYEGKLVPSSRVHELLDGNKNLKMYITNEVAGQSTVTLSEKPILGLKESLAVQTKAPSAENGNLYMAAQAPPKPIADPVEYLKELAKRGATFYIGPHKYTTEEALKMVEKSTNEVTIDVSKYPIVHLGGC